jgi:hypothetical protein
MMSLRKLFLFLIVTMLGLGVPALAQEDHSQEHRIKVGGGATAEVFDGKSASVQVTNAEGKILRMIPLEYQPGTFIYSQPVNTLYVAHSDKKSENYLSAVNLTTSQVDKEIKIGDGPVVDLFVSNGGHRIFSYTAGSASLYGYSYKPPFEPAVTAIDTATNKVVATYNLYDSFRDLLKGKTQVEIRLNRFEVNDRGVLAIRLQAFWIKQNKVLAERLWVFSDRSAQAASMIDPGGQVMAATLSKDKRYLITAIDGDTKGSSLLVIDLADGSSVPHPLKSHPVSLNRFGRQQELWVLSGEEMRAISETGEPGERRIALTEGIPDETISLGDDHAAIELDNGNGGSLHKVALVDLKKMQLQAVLPTASSNATVGGKAGRYIVAFGLSLATGGTVAAMPESGAGNTMAARPDGRILYALDPENHEVTIIDVQTSAVVKRVQVNATITKVQLAPDGKHLLCAGDKSQQINLETNTLEN